MVYMNVNNFLNVQFDLPNKINWAMQLIHVYQLILDTTACTEYISVESEQVKCMKRFVCRLLMNVFEFLRQYFFHVYSFPLSNKQYFAFRRHN